MIEKLSRPSLPPESAEVITPLRYGRPANVDIFFAGLSGETAFSEFMTDEMEEQAALRRTLFDQLGDMFLQIPDATIDVSEALREGTVYSDQVALLYKNLSTFLETDTAHNRLLLYLPFQLLPYVGDTDGKNEELLSAEAAFVDAYREGFRRLLLEDDIRANFVDGDIIESDFGRGEQLRVRKAAHLLPELVEKGVIDTREVLDLLSSSDPLLAASVKETMPALAERSLLSHNDWKSILLSSDPAMQDTALETIQTLPIDEKLDQEERDQLFSLFYPLQPPDHDFFNTLQDRLIGLGKLIERGHLREDDQAHAIQMLLAASRFRQMQYTTAEIMTSLAGCQPGGTMHQLLSSQDQFVRFGLRPQVDAWVHTWGEQLSSSQIMSINESGEKIRSLAGNASESEDGETVAEIAKRLEQAMLHLESTYASVISRAPDTLVGRYRWEQKDKRNKLVDAFAKELAESVIQGRSTPHDLETLTHEEGFSDSHRIAGVRSMREYIDRQPDSRETSEIANDYLEICTALWDEATVPVRDEVKHALYHFVNKGVLAESTLHRFRLTLPKPDALIPSAVSDVLKEKRLPLSSILALMKTDEVMREQLYPVLLLYGSRLQGYSSSEGDLDAALFFKPSAAVDDRIIIEEKLKAEMPELGCIEYFLDDDEGTLKVRDMPLVSNTIAEHDWAHVLFGGIWLGDAVSTEKMKEDLVAACLTEKPRMITDMFDTRDEYLRTMERGIVQYRLMHKAYERLYPDQNPNRTEADEGRDGGSTFWDPGYRRVATRLFISKVFLPKKSE